MTYFMFYFSARRYLQNFYENLVPTPSQTYLSLTTVFVTCDGLGIGAESLSEWWVCSFQILTEIDSVLLLGRKLNSTVGFFILCEESSIICTIESVGIKKIGEKLNSSKERKIFCLILNIFSLLLEKLQVIRIYHEIVLFSLDNK